VNDSAPAPRHAEGRQFKDDDWYGEDLGAARFVDCVFTGVDLGETTTSGAVFERCTFHNCSFGASVHTSTAFVACDVRRSRFFDATLDGCKLVGTVFSDCTMRPLTVRGGQWQSVTIRGTNLSKVDLSGVDLREADLSMSDLSFAVLRNAKLDRAILRETKLDSADLRGASLDGVDLASALLRRTKLDLPGAVLLAELHGADVDPSS
jgi:uncharacterized protein YjbI with pentapeptide repeats